MVKNTNGGSRAKAVARKHTRLHDHRIILPSNPLEIIVCVTKMFGNGMCQVVDDLNNTYIAHIRNKFRGKQKRHNMISVSTIVMVGLREWEKPYKNCDIMEIYSEDTVSQIKQNPSISISNVLSMHHTGASKDSELVEDVEFMNEEMNEDEEPIDCVQNKTVLNCYDSELGEIDIDDV